MKNKKALIILFIANGVAGFAQGITMLAIPWYFAKMEASSFYMLCYAGVTAASLFWGLYAGALVDGFNRKDVFLGTNFIAGMIVLCIASLGFKEEVLANWLIIAVFTSTFFGFYIHYPNLYAFAQEITEPKYYTKVTTYIEIVAKSTQIAAAGIAIILFEGIRIDQVIPVIGHIEFTIAPWKIYQIFLMDGLAYFLSFAVILLISYEPIKTVYDYDEAPLKERLATGFNYLKDNRIISIFGICSYAIFIVVLVQIFALLPVYVENHLNQGGSVLALSEFMYATGSLLSGLVISRVVRMMPIPKSIIVLTFLTSGAFFMAGFSESAAIYYLFALIIGFADSGSRIFRVSYLFSLIPNKIMGRVNSIFNVYSTIARVIFLVAFSLSFFTTGSNITYAYMILGVFTAASGVVLIAIYHKVLEFAAKKKENPAEEPELETA